MSAARFAYSTATGPVTLEVAVADAVPLTGALFPDDRQEDPGGAPDILLERSGDGFAVRTARESLEVPGLAEAVVEAELRLASELVRRSGLPGLHAAGVVLAGRAVLFPGEGGRGKSSLTAALARRGLAVLGDDVVLLDAQGRAHPFRRLLKVEEPARTMLGLPPAPPPFATAWPDAAFFHPGELGSRWAAPAPVGAIVFPERVQGAAASLRPRRPAEVLPGLLGGIVLSERIEPGTFDAVVSALSEADCWALRFGSTADAADALLAGLASGAQAG